MRVPVALITCDRPADAFNADLRQDCAGRRPECAFDRGPRDLE